MKASQRYEGMSNRDTQTHRPVSETQAESDRTVCTGRCLPYKALGETVPPSQRAGQLLTDGRGRGGVLWKGTREPPQVTETFCVLMLVNGYTRDTFFKAYQNLH